jgi:hypothetical protein
VLFSTSSFSSLISYNAAATNAARPRTTPALWRVAREPLPGTTLVVAGPVDAVGFEDTVIVAVMVPLDGLAVVVDTVGVEVTMALEL